MRGTFPRDRRRVFRVRFRRTWITMRPPSHIRAAKRFRLAESETTEEGEAIAISPLRPRVRRHLVSGLDGMALRLAFDADYETVQLTAARRDRLDTAIAAMAADSEFTAVVTRLACLRGISTLTGF